MLTILLYKESARGHGDLQLFPKLIKRFSWTYT